MGSISVLFSVQDFRCPLIWWPDLPSAHSVLVPINPHTPVFPPRSWANGVCDDDTRGMHNGFEHTTFVVVGRAHKHNLTFADESSKPDWTLEREQVQIEPFRWPLIS